MKRLLCSALALLLALACVPAMAEDTGLTMTGSLELEYATQWISAKAATA